MHAGAAPATTPGMTYARLEKGPLQWPCNEQYPDGSERLYADGVFPTAADYCETFGHDLETGGRDPAEHLQGERPRRPGAPQARRLPGAARDSPTTTTRSC